MPLTTLTKISRQGVEKEMLDGCRALLEARNSFAEVRKEQREVQTGILRNIDLGKMTSTQTELDYSAYQIRKQHNHKVVTAEARVDHAKQTARELGFPLPQQISDFRDEYAEDVSDDADGDVLRRVAAFDPDKVLAWRKVANATFPREIEPAHQPIAEQERPGVDSFEAAEPEIGDSLSTIAVDKPRAKIKRYGGPRDAAGA